MELNFEVTATLTCEQNNALNVLSNYETSERGKKVGEAILYYYEKTVQHPKVEILHDVNDSFLLDELVMDEKDALLVKELLTNKKNRALHDQNSIQHREDGTWWHGGCGIQAEDAARYQYDNFNTISRCNALIEGLDKLIEQRSKYDA